MPFSAAVSTSLALASMMRSRADVSRDATRVSQAFLRSVESSPITALAVRAASASRLISVSRELLRFLVDLVEDGENGRLCSIGDGECFVDALRWCLEDLERLNNLKESSRKIAKRFDIDSVAESYQDVLLQASTK